MKNDIPESFQRAIQRTPRHIKKQEVEDLMAEFCPDALEAADLLDALTCGLKRHYDEDSTLEVLLYATALKLALERLDAGYAADGREALESLESMVKRDAEKMP